MLSINQDILTGKANVTYDGKDAPVSSMSFFDSSGKAGIDINIYTCKSKLVINQIRHFLCYHILIFFKDYCNGLHAYFNNATFSIVYRSTCKVK